MCCVHVFFVKFCFKGFELVIFFSKLTPKICEVTKHWKEDVSLILRETNDLFENRPLPLMTSNKVNLLLTKKHVLYIFLSNLLLNLLFDPIPIIV
jgi:hypothetical protein